MEQIVYYISLLGAFASITGFIASLLLINNKRHIKFQEKQKELIEFKKRFYETQSEIRK